jgi:phosphocarrier protein
MSEVIECKIINKLGMHARPAAQFVKMASKFQCEIWVEKDDEPVNGKSIMGLMMLAAGKGEILKLIADGADAKKALDDLSELISSGFGDTE